MESSGVFNLRSDVLDRVDVSSVGSDVYQRFYNKEDLIPNPRVAHERIWAGVDSGGNPLLDRMTVNTGHYYLSEMERKFEGRDLQVNPWRAAELPPEVYNRGDYST